ncbi:hypothetical protein QQF64_024125 [Cirrhinus molitorella]|uniref:Uncharacterized protein n=1 Tax=Cirrhinus molitorella TaxID=172907 RepID=A0ABR3NL10_9TELE
MLKSSLSFWMMPQMSLTKSKYPLVRYISDMEIKEHFSRSVLLNPQKEKSWRILSSLSFKTMDFDLKKIMGQGYDGDHVVELQKLSDTQWACRERSLKALIKLLTDISESDSPDTAAGDAKMYLRAINFEYLVCLEITAVFQVTGDASDALQQKDLDLFTAYTVTDGVLDTVKNLRSEEEL